MGRLIPELLVRRGGLDECIRASMNARGNEDGRWIHCADLASLGATPIRSCFARAGRIWGERGSVLEVEKRAGLFEVPGLPRSKLRRILFCGYRIRAAKPTHMQGKPESKSANRIRQLLLWTSVSSTKPKYTFIFVSLFQRTSKIVQFPGTRRNGGDSVVNYAFQIYLRCAHL